MRHLHAIYFMMLHFILNYKTTLCNGVMVPGTLLDRVVSMGELSILNMYPKLVCQIMIIVFTKLDTFYLIIIPSHIHMNINHSSLIYYASFN